MCGTTVALARGVPPANCVTASPRKPLSLLPSTELPTCPETTRKSAGLDGGDGAHVGRTRLAVLGASDKYDTTLPSDDGACTPLLTVGTSVNTTTTLSGGTGVAEGHTGEPQGVLAAPARQEQGQGRHQEGGPPPGPHTAPTSPAARVRCECTH